MNHPGVYLSILWSILLISIIGLVQSDRYVANYPGQDSEAAYVCPPCGCQAHDPELILKQPGHCLACSMPLIRADRPRIRFLEELFKAERLVSIFHFRLFYPAYILAFFTGFLGLLRDRRDQLLILFYVFLLSHVFYAFKHQLWGTSYSLSVPVRWQYFPIGFLLLTGPSLYLYIKNKQGRIRQLEKQDRWHFLPGIVVVIGYSILFLGPTTWRSWATYNGYDHYLALAEQFTFLVSGAYYGWISWRILNPKQSPAKVFMWLQQLLVFQWLILLSWFFLLFVNLCLFDMMSTSLDYHLIWFLIALFSFVAAYYILFRPELMGPTSRKKEKRLSDSTLSQLKNKLQELMMKEKSYLDPELSLTSLAQQMSIKEKELSELLQEGFASSFYAYVNEFRIKEVKQMLIDPENDRYTNFALAQRAGFSSKSTFFHLFKKHVGMTPGAFKKANRY